MFNPTVQKPLGLMLMLYSISMLPPIGVSLWYHGGEWSPFLYTMLITLATGVALWLPRRRSRRDLALRDGFAVVALAWALLGLASALPLMLSTHPHLSLTDAVFESFSGITTTGATVMTGIDRLPKAILYYRAQLQWLGGMGILVLAVAILPMLEVGGMQLYRAEIPGPMKENKLTPRITETAKALWYIYLGLTVLCALAYWRFGMTPFDAVAHSFATVSTGGFSTHDASLGYFHSARIDAVAVVFMYLAGINHALHFTAWRSSSLRPYLLDPEVRGYSVILLVTSTITVLYLYLSHTFDFTAALHHGIVQAVSIGTSTGFTTAEYQRWPGFLPILLIMVSFIGGCAGSTGGGMKVIRFLLLYKQGAREITRLVHPSAQIPVKVGGKVMPDRVVDAVWGFFSAYVAVFVVLLLVLMATGLDQVTSFSAVAACLNNMGPGLGGVGTNYQAVNDVAKWALSLAMLLGRLEIFTVLVLFTPAFWRR